MNFRLIICSAAFLLTAAGLAQSGSAQDLPLDILVGAKGGVEMSATTGVDKLSPQQQLQYSAPTDDSGFYPGFGYGPGFGLSLEVRLLNMVGLESGAYYMVDNVTGWNDKSVNQVPRGRVTSEQETSALHIPLLLKGVLPTGALKPFLGVGVEFVRQLDSSLEYRTERQIPQDMTIDQYGTLYNARNSIETSNYTLLQLSTGVEIDLGYLRVPIEIRAGYQLGMDDAFDERVRTESDGGHKFIYNGASLGHFGFFTGVIYDFDFLL